MNIALIGYRASGKTTVAGVLEKRAGWTHVNIDSEIEDCFDKSIPGIINDYGWKAFRIMEKKMIRQHCCLDKIILDMGGGAVLDEESMLLVKKRAFTIFLDCPVEMLSRRQQQSYKRPSLTGKDPVDEIREVLAERMPLYRKYADLIINTGDIAPAECAAIIKECITPYLFNPAYFSGKNLSFA